MPNPLLQVKPLQGCSKGRQGFMHISTVKNESCVYNTERRRRWELRKVQIAFIAINFVNEYSKYFVSMLHYKWLNKVKRADRDFAVSSWCFRQYNILCFRHTLKQLFGWDCPTINRPWAHYHKIHGNNPKEILLKKQIILSLPKKYSCRSREEGSNFLFMTIYSKRSKQ